MVSITSAHVRVEIGRQNQLARDLGRAQADISAGTRLQAASDDPVASARVATIRRAQADTAQWSANVAAGTATADRADTALGAVQTSLDRAKELMLRGSSGTLSAADRQSIAQELSGLREDIAAQVDAQDSDGKPLFPVDAPLKLPIGPGVAVAATVSRGEAFGTIDGVLGDAIAALGTADPAARAAANATSLDAIDAAATHLADVRGGHGVRMQRLDMAKEQLAENAVQLDEQRGALAGTDVAQALAFIQQTLTQLNASQTAFARISQQTLFDVLG